MSSPGHGRVALSDRAAFRAPAANPAFRLGWLTILVVTVGVHLYTASAWSWFQDDLLFTSQTTDRGLFDYLFRPIANHFAPGTLGFAWLGTKLAPLNYTWAIVTGTLLAAGATIAWGLALRELFGEKLQILAALVLLSVTPSLLMDSLFWSRGLGTFSTLLAMGLCLWLLARLLVRGWSVRDFVLLTLTYGWGLFIWQKSMLITIPLLFVCLLLGPGDLRGAVRNAVRHLWSVSLLTAAYIPVFILAVKDAPSSSPNQYFPRTLGSFTSFATSGTLDIALPSMVGGPFGQTDSAGGVFPEASGALALGLFALTAVLVVIGVQYRRRGWLAIAMVVTYALVAWGLVFFSNRWPYIGEILIRSPHYTADLLPVMVLASVFLLNRTVLEEVRPLRRPVSEATLAWVRRGTVGYVALVCVAATITTGRTWDTLEPQSPKPYFDSLFAGARDLGAADVYDTRVPVAYVNPVYLDGGSRVSDVLGPLDLPLRFNEPTDRYVVVDEATGEFRKASVVGGYEDEGPGPVPDCGYAVDTGEVTDIPMAGDLYPLDWAMEVTYFTGSDATVLVRTDEDEVELDVPVSEPGSLGTRQLIVSGPVSELSFEGLTGESTVCVTDVRIGIVEASDEAPDKPADD